MPEKSSALVNLQNLSDDDLGQLLNHIREEQERRKWQRIQEVLAQQIFPLSTVDLGKVQNLIDKELQKRGADAIPSTDNLNPQAAKDSLTGQFGANWKKRSASPEEASTIDVQASS